MALTRPWEEVSLRSAAGSAGAVCHHPARRAGGGGGKAASGLILGVSQEVAVPLLSASVSKTLGLQLEAVRNFF